MSDGDGFVTVADASAVGPGEVVSAEVGGREIAVVNVDGEYFALDGLCPHADGPLGDGFVQDACLVCPLHQWEFDVRSGEYVDDPTTKVATYETRVEGGSVQVRVGG